MNQTFNMFMQCNVHGYYKLYHPCPIHNHTFNYKSIKYLRYLTGVFHKEFRMQKIYFIYNRKFKRFSHATADCVVIF